jgi:SSS family solute:Na+ symporter
MLALSVRVGGAYFASALSRLILGRHHEPGHSASDPRAQAPSDLRQHLFALAIVSASLSTASALLHIASGSLGRMYSKNTSRDGRGGVSSSSALSAADSFALKKLLDNSSDLRHKLTLLRVRDPCSLPCTFIQGPKAAHRQH